MGYDDADRWERSAGPLPMAESVHDGRDTGRQEAGLGILVRGLLAHRVPVGDRTRAEIAVLAEQWE